MGMKTKMLFYALVIMFVLTSCAGAPTGGASSGGSSDAGKGLTKEQLKKMGVEETKGSN